MGTHKNVNVVEVGLSDIRDNDNNPRMIKTHKFNKLLISVLGFPNMLYIRPVVVDDSGLILGGNQRYKALVQISKMSGSEIRSKLDKGIEMGHKFDPDEMMSYWTEWLSNPRVPVIRASDLTSDEQDWFIAADNVSSGEWDWDKLVAKWDVDFLGSLGIDLPQQKDSFKKKFNSFNDQNCLYPIVPKFDERHELFIIISDSEVDSNFLREKLNMQKMESYKRGKYSKSNVISIKDVLKSL